MNANTGEGKGIPPLGMALWLLKGGSVADRVAWLVDHDFTAVSLLQSALDMDAAERRDAAAAMKAAFCS